MTPRTPATAGDPLSPEAEEYIRLRQEGKRPPTKRDLQRQIMECEDALLATEKALAEAAAPYREALAALVPYFWDWWQENGYCLRCGAISPDNHEKDCDLAAARRLIEEGP